MRVHEGNFAGREQTVKDGLHLIKAQSVIAADSGRLQQGMVTLQVST